MRRIPLHVLPLVPALLLASADRAQACSDMPLYGSICAFAFDYCPVGFVPLDGRALATSDPAYANYKDFVGGAFGAQRDSLDLPDLRGITPVGAAPPGVGVPAPKEGAPGIPTLGRYRGDPEEKLTPDSVPVHTHGANVVQGATGTGSILVTDLPGDSPSAAGVLARIPTEKVHNPTMAFAPMPADRKGLVALNPAAAPAFLDAKGQVTSPVDVRHPAPIETRPPSLGLTYCMSVQGSVPAFGN
ncbi:phage tail protein [Arenibaculum sp.]|jgi:microcystin-dependent protein|uniref:phage tail protein n=1 Tax=Arenibaculum sp. TaxID=2865862 RepID=UPI002E0EC072|nr:phage tail protein [Arenibaculum sp.]